VEIGEGGFGFDGAHAIAGVIEIYGLLRPDAETATVGLLEALHKRFKYGLPSQTAVLLYELGFADRVIASALADAIGSVDAKATAKLVLSTRSEELSPLLAQYPAYFVEVFERMSR
jgi:POLQ-like helicase